MLLWPHANARYRSETLSIAHAELQLMLPDVEIRTDLLHGAPCLLFTCEDVLNSSMLQRICRHSLMYLLFVRSGETLLPIAGRSPAYVGEDLPGILKYKGKTNELFTQTLLNAALDSSAFADTGEKLTVYDPMCGRGTTLMVAANMGFDGVGTELDKNDIHECDVFLRHYFEYHRMKYKRQSSSLTVSGKKGCQSLCYEYADTAEHYKQKQTQSITLVNADANDASALFGKKRFHLLCCDLPYGVQHGSLGGSLVDLLKTALPSWKKCMKTGGAIALSYNTNTLKPETLQQLLTTAGFVPKQSENVSYSHWVEQAITRDIAIATVMES